MKQYITVKDYVATSLEASVVYGVPLFIYYNSNTTNNYWILYLGNIFFVILVAISTHIINKRIEEGTEMGIMIANGFKLNVISSIACFVLSVIIYYFMGNKTLVYPTLTSIQHEVYNVLMLNAWVLNMMLGFVAVILTAIVYNQILQDVKGRDIT